MNIEDRNAIIPFIYEDKPVRVALDENNEPWWVAKDVCAILGLSNVTMAIDSLDTDERKTVPVSGRTITFSKGIQTDFENTLSFPEGILKNSEENSDANDCNTARRGNPNVNVINEPGLYSLIFRSKKPAAKTFRRWITHEVLPTIRKTGKYETNSQKTESTPAEISDLVRSRMRDSHRGIKLSARIQLMSIVCQVARLDGESHNSDEIYLKYANLCESMKEAGSLPARAPFMDDFVRFFETDCIFDSALSASKADLYEAYERFAQEEGISPQGRNLFFRTLRSYAPVREQSRRFGQARVRYLIGVGLPDHPAERRSIQ